MLSRRQRSRRSSTIRRRKKIARRTPSCVNHDIHNVVIAILAIGIAGRSQKFKAEGGRAAAVAATRRSMLRSRPICVDHMLASTLPRRPLRKLSKLSNLASSSSFCSAKKLFQFWILMRKLRCIRLASASA